MKDYVQKQYPKINSTLESQFHIFYTSWAYPVSKYRLEAVLEFLFEHVTLQYVYNTQIQQ